MHDPSIVLFGTIHASISIKAYMLRSTSWNKSSSSCTTSFIDHPVPMASYFSSPERLEPENAIEQSDLALCVISGQGELRCRDPPIVVNQENGGVRMVFVTFVALSEEV